MKNTDKTYQISQLALMTGLTDRTLRNYLASGILQGEKIDGVWQFTEEQIEQFFRHPSVRPSILAKNNSLVYDFLIEDHAKASEMCVILDVPEQNQDTISAYFCNAISNSDYRNIRFTFDGIAGSSRVILRGNTDDVLELVNGFRGISEK